MRLTPGLEKDATLELESLIANHPGITTGQLKNAEHLSYTLSIWQIARLLSNLESVEREIVAGQ